MILNPYIYFSLSNYHEVPNLLLLLAPLKIVEVMFLLIDVLKFFVGMLLPQSHVYDKQVCSDFPK